MTTQCDPADCTAGCDHCAGHIAIIRTAAGWTAYDAAGRPALLWDADCTTPQEIEAFARHMERMGYTVALRRGERGIDQ